MASRPLRIPDAELPFLDAFEADHPEERERIDEIRHRNRDMRDFAETVIGEIYDHYTTGAPSTWMLVVTLRSFAALLDEDRADLLRHDKPERHEFHAELAELRSRLGARRHKDSKTLGLLGIVDELIDEIANLHMALTDIERIADRERQQTRAAALREAATLVRSGPQREELKRRAATAEDTLSTPEERAAEVGLDIDRRNPPETAT